MTPIAATSEDATPDVLFAGRNRWTPRPWSPPELPGAWLLTYTTAGHGQYRVGAVQVTTDPGDVILAHHDVAIEHRAPGPSSWEHSYVRFDPWPEWRPPAPFTPVADGLLRAQVRLVSTRQRIDDALRRLIADVRARDAARALTGLRTRRRRVAESYAGLRELALTALREVFLLIGEDPLTSGRLDPRVVAALQILADDAGGAHDVSSLAKAAGLSHSRFWHLFREQVGVPPQRAIRLLRLQNAALQLVFTSDAVGAIAEANGFSSIYDFSRQFSRNYGVSPRAYRERNRTPRLPPARASGRRRSP